MYLLSLAANNTNDVIPWGRLAIARLVRVSNLTPDQSHTQRYKNKRYKNRGTRSLSVSLSITLRQWRLTNSLDLLGLISWEAGAKYRVSFLFQILTMPSIETNFICISAALWFSSFGKSSAMRSWWTGNECSAFIMYNYEEFEFRTRWCEFVRPPCFLRCVFFRRE